MAERVVLTLFDCGQDLREDFLLLKLFQVRSYSVVALSFMLIKLGFLIVGCSRRS